MQPFHRLVAAALFLRLVAFAGAAEPERKVLKKEVHFPESGRLYKTYEYYLDAAGKEVDHGLLTLFDYDGYKSEEITYVDGKKHGPFLQFSKSGALLMRGQCTRGWFDGKWEWYHGNGKIRSIKHYDNGVTLGTVRFWTDKGALIGEDEYVRGLKMKETSYYEDGNKKQIVTYAVSADNEYETVMSGAWTYWRPDGTVLVEGVWKDGKPFSGVCYTTKVEGAGDIPSITHEWARYENGKRIEAVKVTPDPLK